VFAHRETMPKLKQGDLLLPEDDPEVIEHLSYMATQVYRQQNRTKPQKPRARQHSAEDDLGGFEAHGKQYSQVRVATSTGKVRLSDQTHRQKSLMLSRTKYVTTK